MWCLPCQPYKRFVDATRLRVSPRLRNLRRMISCLCTRTLIRSLLFLQAKAWENKSVARVLLNNPEAFSGDRDYILNYRLSGKQVDSGLLLYEGEEENFFLLTVQPPDRIRSKEIPPREYIFVVDISGSMNGFPLNTSKKLLKNLSSSLKPTDKFNIVLFSGGSSIMSQTSVPATTANIYNAIRHIENQRGGGGTELRAALEKSFSIPKDETFSRSVIIVTDGYISAERDVFTLIENNLNHTNLFSFGIGSSGFFTF